MKKYWPRGLMREVSITRIRRTRRSGKQNKDSEIWEISKCVRICSFKTIEFLDSWTMKCLRQKYYIYFARII
jgi:hypothetical protein